ncbi:MAG: ANTAR domain-containing protein [Endomicrobium sp.]|jgi:response regulator NasT|nr:ANTAR domain-containing protein [Endomicrobium sp.]
MEKDKVVIVGSKEIVSAVSKNLETTDFAIFASTASANDAFGKINSLFPDLVIADYNLSDMTGLDFAKTVESLHICPVIILANQTQSDYINDLKKDALDIFCISKPINSVSLNHTAYLAVRLTKRIHEYETTIQDLKQQIENRKIVEKAKGILMKKFDMSENDVYVEMRKKAMNSSKPIEQIAKTIIEMFKFFE